MERVPLLQDVAPRVLVLDEAQILKNRCNGYAAVAAVSARSPWVLVMTGTPLETSPEDVSTLLSLLPDRRACFSPADWERWVDFRWQERAGRRVRVAVAFRAEALDEVRAHLAPWVTRRLASDVGAGLPEVVETVRFVPPTGDQGQAWARAHRRRGAQARTEALAIARVYGTQSAVADEVVRHVLAAHKVVVRCSHLDLVAAILALLNSAGVRVAVMTGATPVPERNRICERFRNDDGLTVLLCTAVVERGLNLQVTGLVISAGITGNHARQEQFVGRARREGSKFSTVEHVIVLADTPANRRAYQRHDRGRAQASRLLDGLPDKRPKIRLLRLSRNRRVRQTVGR